MAKIVRDRFYLPESIFDLSFILLSMKQPFKELICNLLRPPDIEGQSVLDKAAIWYKKTPRTVRPSTSLIPKAAAINRYLTDCISEREQKNTSCSIKELQKYYEPMKNMLDLLDEDHVEQEGPELINMYFERCKKTYQQEKIEIFRNIWINGMIDLDHDLEEKAHVFDLAASLTLEQIQVLKAVYEGGEMGAEDIAEALCADEVHARHLCIGLQGRGLLYASHQSASIDGGDVDVGGESEIIDARADTFSPTEYVKTFVQYLSDPDFLG